MPERIFVVLGLSIFLASAVPFFNPAGPDTGNREEKITLSNRSHETNLSVSATTNSSNVVDRSTQLKFDPNSMKTEKHGEELADKDVSPSVMKPLVKQSRRFDGLENVESKAKDSSYPISEKGLNKGIQSRIVGHDNPTDEASVVSVNSPKHTHLEDNDEKDPEETARHSARSRFRSANKPHVEDQDRYPAKTIPPVVLVKETSRLESVKSDRLAQNVSEDLVSVPGKQSKAEGDVKGIKVENEPVKEANFQNIEKPNVQIAAPDILSEKNLGTGKGFKKTENVGEPEDDEEKDESEEDSKESQDIGGAQLKPPSRPKVRNSLHPFVDKFRFADTRAEKTADLQGGRRLLPPYPSKSMKYKVEPAPKLSDIHSDLLPKFPIDKTTQDELSFPVEYILMVICLIVIVVMLLWRRLWFTICTVCTRRHSASETGGHRYKASYKPLSASA